MQNIQEVRLRIKNFAEDAVSEWGLIAIVLLLGLASFGLGRLSAIEETRPAVSIAEASHLSEQRPISIGGLIVASRKGSAYHYPWCSGAQTMAEQNKIWFASEKDARAAGYSPAKNCKGLGTASSE
ncbi:hypothetical protein HYW59_02840 [Candidatus Kaiserbacteria bacterium]|nr:hypothetical protein [Candidatus Kaiserbacteria bacterium]